MGVGSRKLVTIERRTAGRDPSGQPATTWEPVATVWADIRHQFGLEAIKAGADVSTVRASIRIRFRTDVDAGMRVAYGLDRYSIKGVLPDAAGRKFVDLVCEVVK